MSRTLVYLIAVTVFLSGCSKYQKLLKSKDLNEKYEAAIKLYDDKKFYKALPLFEELTAVYRGTSKAEKLFYYYAYTEYGLGDYLLAGHRFDNFAKTFPGSEFNEECRFMGAVCSYRMSPRYSLDPSNTLQAINKLQLFIDIHPNSDRVDSSNVLIDKLRDKLETKAYKIAKQYFLMRNYKSAIVSFENLLQDFPDSEYREEAKFMKVKAHYLLASFSVSSKKAERYQNAIDSYVKFVDSFPRSEYIKEAEVIYDSSKKARERILNKT